MIRRLVIATALAATLGTAGAAAAAASPVDGTQSRWACISVRPADTGYCVSSPLDLLPDLPKVPVPAP